jgi:colanic acid biosynthesis glycosyl transferase WcaI
MRILIYSLNYSPELIGIGKFTGEMAEWLVNREHKIRVITTPPYYPSWYINENYSQWKYCKEILCDILVQRCPLWVPRRPSGIKRVLHLASFALSSFPKLLEQISWRPDVVWVVEPAFFYIPGAILAARLSKAKAWLHIQDLEIDAAFKLGILPSTQLKHWVEALEKWLMQRFDQISTISYQMLNRLERKGIQNPKPMLFCNWVDTHSIYPLKRPSPFRKEIGLPDDSIVALYSGNMGIKQGLELIIEAARYLVNHPRIVFVLCGRGVAYHHIRDLAVGLSNIYWLPLQPLDRLNDLLNLADIHLLPQCSVAEDLVMPSKLTGMLASGRPILATVHEESLIAQLLRKAGSIVSPGNVDEFVAGLKDLSDNQGKRRRMGAEARRYALEHLDKEAVLLNFERQLLKCKSRQTTNVSKNDGWHPIGLSSVNRNE